MICARVKLLQIILIVVTVLDGFRGFPWVSVGLRGPTLITRNSEPRALDLEIPVVVLGEAA